MFLALLLLINDHENRKYLKFLSRTLSITPSPVYDLNKSNKLSQMTSVVDLVFRFLEIFEQMIICRKDASTNLLSKFGHVIR